MLWCSASLMPLRGDTSNYSGFLHRTPARGHCGFFRVGVAARLAEVYDIKLIIACVTWSITALNWSSDCYKLSCTRLYEFSCADWTSWTHHAAAPSRADALCAAFAAHSMGCLPFGLLRVRKRESSQQGLSFPRNDWIKSLNRPSVTRMNDR